MPFQLDYYQRVISTKEFLLRIFDRNGKERSRVFSIPFKLSANYSVGLVCNFPIGSRTLTFMSRTSNCIHHTLLVTSAYLLRGRLGALINISTYYADNILMCGEHKWNPHHILEVGVSDHTPSLFTVVLHR